MMEARSVKYPDPSCLTSADNVLIGTVGLPCSGKSTWVHRFVKGYAERHNTPVGVVNLDAVRLGLYGERFIEDVEDIVWAMGLVFVKHHFLYGIKTVVLDEACINREKRDYWASPNWKVYWKTFDTTKDECVERAERPTQVAGIELLSGMYEELQDDELQFEQLFSEELTWL